MHYRNSTSNYAGATLERTGCSDQNRNDTDIPHDVNVTAEDFESVVGRFSPTISVSIVKGVVRLLDFWLLLMAALLAFCLHSPQEYTVVIQKFIVAVIGIFGSAFWLSRGADVLAITLQSPRQQISNVITSLFVGLTLIYVCQLLLRIPQGEALRWDAIWFVSASTFMAISRGLLFWLMRWWRRLGYLTRKIAVVGATDLGSAIIDRVALFDSDFRIVGLYDDLFIKLQQFPTIVQGDIASLIKRCRKERVDIIVISVPLPQVDRIARLIRLLSETVADVYLAVDVLKFDSATDNELKVAIGPSILVQQKPLKDWDQINKRIFDVTLASLALVFLSPLLVLIALVIKIDSAGPTLFCQPRLGFNNTLFTVYKFRTMHHHLTDLHANQQAMRGDKRVTRFGKLLRKLSLDELPQLLNVVAGDMSLVGPRPHALNTKAGEYRFSEAVAGYAMRHRVKPGITGWAQVNGWRGETQTIDQLQNRVACDLHYIENWSLIFDIKIIVLTLLREIFSSQAY